MCLYVCVVCVVYVVYESVSVCECVCMVCYGNLCVSVHEYVCGVCEYMRVCVCVREKENVCIGVGGM